MVLAMSAATAKKAACQPMLAAMYTSAAPASMAAVR